MYFVDRNQIENNLIYIEELRQVFQSNTLTDSEVGKLALERITHGFIEAFIDVGNQMIDGFIMRDPGSYEDILDILNDEKVIPENEAESFKEVIRLRKDLVSSYTKIDHHHFQQVLEKNIEVVHAFPGHVRSYLEKELGPVSAFLPENENKEGK
ncbi:DUF86 domain-containing protein [Thalassorhabdus alkalitolerans]|uniref:DUF86 domain-containing protein n=1 Tax=Thalassorhabdus alkalitolerans TaxID=2282697 RepID=A0ABW0YFI4_9BACI|nr:DUF86 domain-containing protein [Bacillus sp. FJAT-44742]